MGRIFPPKYNLKKIFYLLGILYIPVKMGAEKVVNEKVTFQDLALILLHTNWRGSDRILEAYAYGVGQRRYRGSKWNSNNPGPGDLASHSPAHSGQSS